MKLKKMVNGTATTLKSVTYSGDPATFGGPNSPNKVRFRVDGSSVKARIWPASQPEPTEEAWDFEVTNTAVNTAGVLQLTHYYSSGSARSVFIDDMALFNLLTTYGASYVEDHRIPAPGSHGTKVYIAPARQPKNVGCDGFSETQMAEHLADVVADHLVNFGYEVKVGYGEAWQKRDASNQWGPAAHVPIHSNSDPGAGNWPPQPGYEDVNAKCSANSAGGTIIFTDGTMASQTLSQDILDRLHPTINFGTDPGSPGSPDSVTQHSNTKLAEIYGIDTAVVGYVERAFHTHPGDKDWMLIENGDIALAIARGIDDYFGCPGC